MLLKYLTKLAVSALLGIALLGAPARAAGTLPLAMSSQLGTDGKPLAGCLVYFFVAGTVATPQNSYSDFSLSQNPNAVLQCDQAGRVPMFWLADGLVHVRLTDSSGVQVIDTTMQVLGPSSGGGGGGGTVDPTTIMATGDMKARYGTGALAGFVRANGLTVGNAACGCSERANADTQALFVYLYNTDPNLAVSGGRTGNALNDFNANKQLSLPDWRGRALAFLDDMGNSASGRLDSTMVSPNATTLGAAGGVGGQTLSLAQLPAGITSSGTNPISVTSAANVTQNAVYISYPNAGGGGTIVLNSTPTNSALTSTGSNSISVTSNNTLGQSFNNVQPTKLATIYLKL